jgi:hypothetical protein
MTGVKRRNSLHLQGNFNVGALQDASGDFDIAVVFVRSAARYLRRRSRHSRVKSSTTVRDLANLFGLTLHDGNLAVLHVVAEGERTADPKSLALGGCDLVPDALGGDLPLELSVCPRTS